MNAPADLARLRSAAAAAPPDRKAAIARARKALAPSLKDRAAPVYPVAALGPLAEVCSAIAEHGQVQPAMVGQCLLGAASLLTQGLANVETLNGRRPLSLFLLTLGDSGDGKSTAQGAALGAVMAWQRAESMAYREALSDFEATRAARKKGGPMPDVPACPYRLVGDATVEGLRRDLDTGVCAQGLFSDEAAAIIGGYGMSQDHKAKSAAVFNRLWDSGYLSVSRITGGRVERHGRRMAMHWLIQPTAAADAVADPLLSQLGFWPRFLAAWPSPQEPRRARPFEPDELPAVRTFWARCRDLLALPLPEDAGEADALPLQDDARAELAQAFERFEVEARRGGLRMVKPFALRASEQACRVAGALAMFAGHQAVDRETMRGALAIVAYSLATWRAILEEGAANPGGSDALALLEWLTERPGWAESTSAILTRGPAHLRTKSKRDEALAVLEEAGLIVVADRRAVVIDGGAHAG